MKIVYGNSKRLTNLQTHGLDFADLDLDFFDQAVVVPAKGNRSLAIGPFQGMIIAAVLFKPLGAEALSIISLRPASTKERKLL
ncbi:hypothetical protein SAMN05880582_10969 [Rhizobium sp. RU20A]|uniref:BrnT family toxin n=1 Tax=Rhizobium sp. RU20A TaxID=1907412 RepID=UPI0009545502|nr:BrnT family toxin [Rhizobium sp. RU20A]SIR28030.1 hypothetical protein SAMN05880582_10969 [Rhizobium sp. RU20A]